MSDRSSPLLTPIPYKQLLNHRPLRHLLIGSPQAVRHTIHELHVLNYAEAIVWSPLLPTNKPDEVMSILIHYLSLE
jgi:hypothetical protein